MTLQDFFNWIQQRPDISILYCGVLPLLAWLIGTISGPAAGRSPWNYLYTVIIYAISIPGIFALTLNFYFFFWERRSILEANLLIQFLPVASMLLTLYISSRFVEFAQVPGFGRLSALMVIIGVLLVLMWILDRTRIFVFTGMPFIIALILLVGLVWAIAYYSRKLIR